MAPGATQWRRMKDSITTTGTVRSDGRVTIKEEARETLGLEGGEALEMDIEVVARPEGA